MIYTYYVLANTSKLIGDKPITIDKHQFDDTNDEDLQLIAEYMEENGIVDFEDGIRGYLCDDEVAAYNQHFIEAMVLSEKQLQIITAYPA